jgi:hypothetical protein
MAKKVTVKSKRAYKAPQSYGRLVSKAPRNSGKTASEISVAKSTIKLKKVGIEPTAGGAALVTEFLRMDTDASPGWNSLIISGLPVNTRVISVWITEWVPGNFSHAGNAFFNTVSVQLFNRGTQCRANFFLNFDRSLPAAAMIIHGPA